MFLQHPVASTKPRRIFLHHPEESEMDNIFQFLLENAVFMKNIGSSVFRLTASQAKTSSVGTDLQIDWTVFL